MTILINLIGLALIVFIIWWFWVAKSTSEQRVTEAITNIIVENGVYTPNIIRTTINKPINLNFIRKDATPCLETVIFDDFDVSAELSLAKATKVSFTPNKTGEFDFTCQMGMYRGKLIVEETS